MEFSVVDYVALGIMLIGVGYWLYTKYGSKLTAVTPVTPVVSVPVIPTMIDYLDDLVEIYNHPLVNADQKLALENIKSTIIVLEKK